MKQVKGKRVLERCFGMVALLLTGVMLLGCGGTATAQVEPGQAMPDFKLKDLNGKEHSLADYKGKIVVIEFCSHNCPYFRGADPQLIELAKKYADQGVVVLGIDSNTPNDIESIRKYAEEKGKNYPILKDEGNAYADEVGATRTPEVFVVDKEGKVAYHGAFDDRKNPEKTGETPYVENAVKALIEGKPVETPTAKAWGCTIKRK